MAKILVVDDDVVGLEAIVHFLRINGHTCVQAMNAREARHLLDTMEFDLVITDQHMPGESGLQLLSYVFENHSKIAGIIITGSNDCGVQSMALEMGALAYMNKPFCLQELLDRISNIV